MDWEWVIQQRGEQAARELAEELRMSCGDAAADEWTAEIDRIVNEAALETSAASLGEALEALHTAIASTREVVNLPETTDGDNERGALTTLLAAAEKVMAELDEFQRRPVDGAVRLTAHDNGGAGECLSVTLSTWRCRMGNTQR